MTKKIIEREVEKSNFWEKIVINCSLLLMGGLSWFHVFYLFKGEYSELGAILSSIILGFTVLFFLILKSVNDSDEWKETIQEELNIKDKRK